MARPQQNSIREARSLAQRLYGKCRDSTSGYKVLAAPIRKLRNILEEFEELSIERNTIWPENTRLAVQLDTCRSILQELELTLQSHRCSTHRWQDVLQQTIVRLTSNISLTTNDLSLALESIINLAAPPVRPQRPLTIDTHIEPVSVEDGNASLSRKFSWEDGGTKEDERKLSIARFDEDTVKQIAAVVEHIEEPEAEQVQVRERAHSTASSDAALSLKSAVEELLEETEELSQSIIDAMLEDEAATTSVVPPQQQDINEVSSNNVLVGEQLSDKAQSTSDRPTMDTVGTTQVAGWNTPSAESKAPSIAEAPTTPAFVVMRDSLASAMPTPSERPLEEVELSLPPIIPDPVTLFEQLEPTLSPAVDALVRNDIEDVHFRVEETAAPLQNESPIGNLAESADDASLQQAKIAELELSHTDTSPLTPIPTIQVQHCTIESIMDDVIQHEPTIPIVDDTSKPPQIPVSSMTTNIEQSTTIFDDGGVSSSSAAIITGENASDSTPHNAEAQIEQRPVASQVFSPRSSSLPSLHQQSLSLDTGVASDNSSPFQSPFSIFDPLSVDIDSASHFLLGSPEVKKSHRRSRYYSSAHPNSPQNVLDGFAAPIKSIHGIAEHVVNASSEDLTKQYEDQTELFEPTSIAQDDESHNDDDIAGLGITSIAAEQSATMYVAVEKPANVTLDEAVTTDTTADPDGTVKTAESADETDSAISESKDSVEASSLVRNDSVHAFPQRLSSLQIPSIHESTEDATAALAALANDEEGDMVSTTQQTTGDESSPTAYLRAKWQSLKPSSVQALQRSSTQLSPKSRFSLQQQFRRVSFRTRRAGEPATLSTSESPISPRTARIEEGVEMIAESPIAGSTKSPASEKTETPISPRLSLRIVDKELPAIPPPQPERPPPAIPDSPLKKYRVVNIAPSIRSGISEDLYSSSRPTSPALVSPKEILPMVDISAATLQGDEKPPELREEQGAVSPDKDAAVDSSAANALIANENIEEANELRSISIDSTPTELHNSLAHPPARTVSGRRSVDALSTERYFRIELDEPTTGSLKRRQRSMSALPKIEVIGGIKESDRPLSATSTASGAPTSYYSADLEIAKLAVKAPNAQLVHGRRPSVDNSALDIERLHRLCRCWQAQQWESAERYLCGHLDSMLEQGKHDAARRVMHLQGVCASMRGQWQPALTHFVSVLHTGVTDLEQLDWGDFAAYYWLGDTYALLNRRTEALLAYSMAAQTNAHLCGPISQAMLLNEEQGALLVVSSVQELLSSWQKLLNANEKSTDSILNRSILDTSIITSSLEAAAQCRASENPILKARNRASVFCELEGFKAKESQYYQSRLFPHSFDINQSWPLLYDPFFVARNVATGRLCDVRSDLLTVLYTSPTYRIPKSGPIGTARLDCFTCNHADWLIVAIRQCLVFLEMRWDEVANDQGCWFLVRFAVKSRNIIAANYFAISLFKQGMRPGYGVEVCVDGVKASRILAYSPEYVNGVHHTCDRRLKKLVKDYLSHAYKLWLKEGKPPVENKASQAVQRTLSQFQRMPASLQAQADGLMPSRTPTLPRRPDLSLYA